jgi:hypothetical protein
MVRFTPHPISRLAPRTSTNLLPCFAKGPCAFPTRLIHPRPTLKHGFTSITSPQPHQLAASTALLPRAKENPDEFTASMAAEKRKHEADDNPYESRRMRLRTTSARTKHQITRQRTHNRKRSNPFFEHLPLYVRRVIYDYMELPPFKTAKMCAGLYLSCR